MSKKYQKLAARYARALIRAMDLKRGDLSSLHLSSEKIRDFSDIWKENVELRTAVQDPSISLETKTKIINEISVLLSAPDYVRKLLDLLVQRRRINLLPEISEAFFKEVDKFSEIQRVQVETAKSLSEGEKSQIFSEISKAFSSKPEVDWLVNPQLIAGIVIRHGSKVLDSSIKGKLQRVEVRLTNSI